LQINLQLTIYLPIVRLTTQYNHKGYKMTTELYWLTLTTLMTGLFWMPYIINRMKEDGIWGALSNPETDSQPKAAWAQRMMAAHSNAIENLVIFAPLAIAVHLTGTGTELTAIAVKAYFFIRLTHYVVYSLGIPVVRTLMFIVGFACQVILAISVLS